MSYNPNHRELTPQEKYRFNLLEEKKYAVGLTPQEEQEWWKLYSSMPQ